MDFSEKWGKSVDDAVKLALDDLKLTSNDMDKVKVTVLEEPTKGFLGIGAKLAKVRVERIPEPKEEKKEIVPEVKDEMWGIKKANPKEVKEKPQRNDRGGRNRKRSSGNNKERQPEKKFEGERTVFIREKPADLQETTDNKALTFLKELAENMMIEISIKTFENESCLYVEIEGKDAGTIIGKRGQTLDAVQYLTSLVVNKDSEKYIRVIVDAENYREKRERTLEQLANRLADKVKRTGKSVRLEPMNPYERKVIHATLQRYSGVTTRSEGEEPYRRVIIVHK